MEERRRKGEKSQENGVGAIFKKRKEGKRERKVRVKKKGCNLRERRKEGRKWEGAESTESKKGLVDTSLRKSEIK
jgi:hypothetical protein